MVERCPYDIVFMDCSMPGMDGYEATRRIRAIEQDLGRGRSHVVALTAHSRDTDAAGWQAAGMDAYLTKPFTVAQIGRVSNGATRPGDPTPDTTPGETPADQKNAHDDWRNRSILDEETIAMLQMLVEQNGPAILERIVGLFRTNAPAAFRDLTKQQGDAAETARLAHALKSMCSSAGAGRAAAICGAIEKASNHGRDVEPGLYEALRVALEAAESCLSGLVSQASEYAVATA